MASLEDSAQPKKIKLCFQKFEWTKEQTFPILCVSVGWLLFSVQRSRGQRHTGHSPAPALMNLLHLCLCVICARVSPMCVTGPVPLREAGWDEGRPRAKLRMFPSLCGNRVAVPVASLILAREWKQLFLESFLAPISTSVLQGEVRYTCTPLPWLLQGSKTVWWEPQFYSNVICCIKSSESLFLRPSAHFHLGGNYCLQRQE